VAGIEGGTTVVASALVSLLWVSINEEIRSRGMVPLLLTPLGPMCSAIGVGFLFGVGHLQKFGFACAGLRFAIGSVWPMVVVHGLDDFVQLARQSDSRR
jgi:membrane protease YdiL (CAAX protease family)